MSTERRSLLVIQPMFDVGLPRNIRTWNLIPYLLAEYEIDLVCFGGGSPERSFPGVRIHRLRLSWLSRCILNKTFSGYRIRHPFKLISRGLSYLLRRLILFPDPWRVEQDRLVQAVARISSRPDVVLFSIIPYSLAEIVGRMRRMDQFARSRFVFDIGDPLSFPTHLDVVTPRNVAYQRSLLAQADAVIVTNEATRKFFIDSCGASDDRIAVIPQGADIQRFRPVHAEPRNTILRQMVYAGTFYRDLRDPTVFLESAARVLCPADWTIQFFGGLDRSWVKAECRCLREHPWAEQSEVLRAYQAAAVLLYFDNARGFQTSGKLFELLALKKMILFIYENIESPTLALARDFPNVRPVRNDALEMDAALRALDASKQLGELDYDVRPLSWESRAADYLEVLRGLFG